MPSAVRAVSSCPGCAALAARIDTLERRLAALEAAAPRDQADVELRRAIVQTTAARWFSARDLHRHAAVVAPLRQALVAADVVTVQDVALWLRRTKGLQDGIVIAHRRRLWRAVYASDA